MFRFIKKCFFTTMVFFGSNLKNADSLKCISINNQEHTVRPEIVSVNSDKPVFFPFII